MPIITRGEASGAKMGASSSDVHQAVELAAWARPGVERAGGGAALRRIETR
jgi:hypothetical protein